MKKIIILFAVMACTAKTDERFTQAAVVLHNAMLEKASLVEHQILELRQDTSSHINQDSVSVFSAYWTSGRQTLLKYPVMRIMMFTITIHRRRILQQNRCLRFKKN